MQVVIFFGCLLMGIQISEQGKASARQIFIRNQPYNMGGAVGYEQPLVQPENQQVAAPGGNLVAQTETIAVIQRRWMKTQSFCNSVTGRVAKLISKIEETVLGLPLALIKAALGIPTDVVKLSINLAQSLLPKLEKSKQQLEGFFETAFDLPAKAMYGTVSIFLDLMNKIVDWGSTCRSRQVCESPFPAVGGYGPCGGRWPCTKVTACTTITCMQASRDLEVEISSAPATTQEKPEENLHKP
ncbi:hypothetical protein GE061_008222 [Apolygus lucorum]|uniref:Uncharacterized protein n=1 Tax=Apolygus lucorum TaxID=248454 RepID=A0A6A4IL88_APOLU|nr:hypothetical protein GE061_008222 [Apolygus lucorum]